MGRMDSLFRNAAQVMVCRHLVDCDEAEQVSTVREPKIGLGPHWPSATPKVPYGTGRRRGGRGP